MLNVLNLRALIGRADGIAVGIEAAIVDHQRRSMAVAFCASNEFGVWNQERVYARLRWIESAVEIW